MAGAGTRLIINHRCLGRFWRACCKSDSCPFDTHRHFSRCRYFNENADLISDGSERAHANAVSGVKADRDNNFGSDDA
jgi:hypothetical protein